MILKIGSAKKGPREGGGVGQDDTMERPGEQKVRDGPRADIVRVVSDKRRKEDLRLGENSKDFLGGVVSGEGS